MVEVKPRIGRFTRVELERVAAVLGHAMDIAKELDCGDELFEDFILALDECDIIECVEDED